MKKVNINMISTRLIRRILLRDIAARTRAMSNALYGDPSTFKGILPATAAAIEAIVVAFLSAQATAKVGGSVKKMAFVDAKKAIYALVLEFAPYVDGIAKGDLVILNLSTLPTTADEVDIAAAIAAGGVAANIKVKQGKLPREVAINCDSFGLGVGYLVILSEGMPLQAGFSVNNQGQITNPAGNRIFINFLKDRKKTITDLLPKTEYFAYYVLTYGNVVGVISVGVSVVTSA